MPTEAVKSRRFIDAFNGTVRFEIPFFQRGYAWEKKQWEQLFLDINEQLISELNVGTSLDELELFFGPIVVLERSGGVPELKEFLVIDGQQRITTIYLLLAVIKDELLGKKHLSPDAQIYANKLSKYIINEVETKDDYLKLKVFSCKGDRLPTYRVVFGTDSNPITPFLQTDLQLYIPGKNRVDEFKSFTAKKLKSGYPDVSSLWQLAEVVLKCLKVVWIPLDEKKDDPQSIFESLNDKGMPLKASELLCSYLFRPIIEAKEEFEDLHNKQWLASIRLLENDDRFEDYLRNLFSIGENKMVGKHRMLYVHFKAKNRDLSVLSAKQQLKEISANADIFRSIRSPMGYAYADAEINELLIAISNTRMDSSTPFVLSVLKELRNSKIGKEAAYAILRETLVLLVRRKMTELPTTQYDAMFPALLAKVIYEPNYLRAIHDQFRKNNVWVSDQEFENAIINKSAYRTRDLAFCRMLLIEIDKRLQSHGQFPDYLTVGTIEHTLPQTLTQEWKDYLGADWKDEHLQAVTDSIGNLCLLSGPANSTAGQSPFTSKVSQYSLLTALARDIVSHQGTWNLEAIRARSKKLAAEAISIWAWAPD